MIFQQMEEIEQGLKSQTRRLYKGEGWAGVQSVITVGRGHKRQRVIETLPCFDGRPVANPDTIRSVYAPSGALKWRVGNSYAVQPKRGAAGVPGLRIVIETIRLIRLHDMGGLDARAEGIVTLPDGRWGTSVLPGQAFPTALAGYRALWDSINKGPGVRRADNPLVWTLEFKVEKKHVLAE